MMSTSEGLDIRLERRHVNPEVAGSNPALVIFFVHPKFSYNKFLR